MAGEKAYSAGAVFLQVVPVFKDAMRQIRKESQDWGKAFDDELAKAGNRGAQRAINNIRQRLNESGLGDALGDDIESGIRDGADRGTRAFDRVEAGANRVGRRSGEAFRRHLTKALNGVSEAFDESMSDMGRGESARRLRRDIERLGADIADSLDIDGDVDIDPRRAIRQIELLRGRANTLASSLDDLADRRRVERISAALAPLEDVFSRERQLNLTGFENRVRMQAQKAAAALRGSLDPELQRLRTQLEDIDVSIGIDIDAAGAVSRMQAIQRALEAQVRDITIDVDTRSNALSAGRALESILSQTRALDNLDRSSRRTATSQRALSNSLFSVSGSGDQAANSFRAFNWRVLAGVTLLPTLVPILGALGGGLLALLPIFAAVGAGLGTMILGFSGIGGAVKALNDVQTNAAQDSLKNARTMRDAAQSVEDAQRGVVRAEQSAAQASEDAARQVARAREAAARSIESAMRRQRDAQEDYRDSVDSVRDSEEALRAARVQAEQDQKDLQTRMRQNALDIRQGVVDVFNATVQDTAVRQDGSSTNLDREESSIALERAQLRLAELRSLQAELAQEEADQRRKGIEGSSAVTRAQDDLNASLERQSDAQEALQDANRDLAEARLDATRTVDDAVRAQQRAEISGAQQVADAQRGLARAQQGYADALYDTSVVGSTSMQALDEAMGKLSPAGQKFALFLFGLRGEFRALRDVAQEEMLPGVQNAFEQIIGEYGPEFKDFVANMASVTGGLFESLGDSLTGPAWQGFFAQMDALGPRMAQEFGETTLNWMEIFASLLTIAAPYAERLSLALLDISERNAAWMQSAEGTAYWTDFMEWSAEHGPTIADALWSMVQAFIAIGVAIAPWALSLIDIFDAIFDFIVKMDPEILGLMVSTVLTLAFAFQIAHGAISLLFGGLSLLNGKGPLGALGRYVFILGLIAGAAIIAYTEFEWFRDIVNGVVSALEPLGRWIGEHIDTFVLLAGVLSLAYLGYQAFKVAQIIWINLTWAMFVAQNAFNVSLLITIGWIALVVVAVIGIIAALVYLWKTNDDFRNAIISAWEWIKATAITVWQDYVQPALIRTGEIMKMVWEDYLWPALKAFGEFMSELWSDYIWPALQAIATYYTWLITEVMVPLWRDVLWPALRLIGTVIWELWTNVFWPVLGLIVDYWLWAFGNAKWAWDNILWPVLKAVGAVLLWLWEAIIAPVLGWIGDRFADVFGAIGWAVENLLQPAFALIHTALDGLRNAFSSALEFIGSLWDGLKNLIMTPVKWVVDTVINNGLIKGFNWIADLVGIDKIDPIDTSGWVGGAAARATNRERSGPRGGTVARATGGVLPGYTPGRDVHEFVSPTAGRLLLSGGEAIMRPEWTAALGTGYINAMNAAARSGGVAGVRRAMGMQAFASGGVVWPAAGTNSRHTKGYPWAIWSGDINQPGTQDYGNPVKAYADGVVSAVRTLTGSYGKHIRINHPDRDLNTLYAHLSSMLVKVGDPVVAGQMIGRVGSTGNSSGPHLHFEVSGGGAFAGAAQGASHDESFPDVLLDVARGPISWAREQIAGPLERTRDAIGNSGFAQMLTAMPEAMLPMVGQALWNILPGPIRAGVSVVENGIEAAGSAIGALGSLARDAAEWVFADGGVIPHNGTMMYDDGGYLPPGITSVVNLTGKPEPVFTADQFAQMGGRSNDEDLTTFHYEPHFTESDLTAEDVASDLNFEIRRLTRRPKDRR